jgi:Rps23 Pro-64 3,4-dihydroxylase Tpa1-like proline 4-hydroxylase
MNDVSLDEVLLSKRNPNIQSEHFPYFELDEFVPAWLYDKLEAEFPLLDAGTNQYAHGKVFINSRNIQEYRDEFFAERPYWRRVIEILESQEFVSDVERTLRPYLLRHRYLGALRKWRAYPNGAKLPPLDRATQIAYEWSAMPPGALVNPHTDKCAKLATFVWHFPEQNWKPEYSGPTQFFKPKSRKHDVNWSNFKLPFDEVETLHSSDAKANRLVMFAKTANSWHAVPPIECPEGVSRRVFIFNIGMPFDDRSSFTMRAVESFYRRTEGWRFNDFSEVNRKSGI